ncbi:MAG: class I SAM-dependent methyltransferase [Desulfosoma sp.]
MKVDPDEWFKCWQARLQQYLEVPPRTGIFIHSFFPKVKSVLEIACGSSRDSIYLAKRGVKVTASDYEGRLIEKLRKRFSHPNLRYDHADAFQLPYLDDSFDCVFHNGFFIYMPDDMDILLLLKEQERVAKIIVFFVHNQLNKSLVGKFKQLALRDPLYDIRFFEPSEVEAIVKSSMIKTARIKIAKFGGKYDAFYSKMMRRVVPNKILYLFCEKIVPRLYQKQAWEETERVCCMVWVEK